MAVISLIAATVAALLLAGWIGFNTFRRYFVEWGPSDEAKLAFHGYDLELADLMARDSGPDTVYLLPLDSAAGIVNPLLDTITFVYQGQAAYDFLPDDEDTLYYTVSDEDTFTPGPPPPPPPPYQGPFAHDDHIRIEQFQVTGHTQWFQTTVNPAPVSEWETERKFSVHVHSLNDTGEQKVVNFTPEWDDRGDMPMGVPPEQVHGTADDEALSFTKVVYLLAS